MTTKKKAAAVPPPAAPKGRAGLAMIAGHFAPAVQRELKILAIREQTTVQSLLVEALTHLFTQRGLPSVAELENEKGTK
jgi:hypothetical protein